MPTKWVKFVDKQKVKHNLIIKDKKNYKCTYCKYEFNSNAKVNSMCKCPNCKNEYLVKSSKLVYYDFKDELAILDRVDNYYIVRAFELKTRIRNGKLDWFHCYEWGRKIFDNHFTQLYGIINDNVVGTIGGYFVGYRKEFNDNWRYTNSYYDPIDWNSQFIFYPSNLKQILGIIPEYKYSQLWELLKHVDYCDLIYLLKNYNQSIEFLTKMKLYNLAINPRAFKNKKNFEERFMGLSKDYLPFIRKHNLDISELEILSIIKDKNIELIRKIDTINNYKELMEFINLKKTFELTDLNKNNSHEYYDYLRIIKTMKFDMKNSKYLYPKNIKEAHDQAVKEYEVKKNKGINNSIKRRNKQLIKNQYQNNKYSIFPASSIEDLEDESSQMNNCVRTYAEKYAKGICDIYFMRLISDQNKSLVTVEVQNNKIVQKRTKNNEITTKEQDKFLEMWEKKILKKVK